MPSARIRLVTVATLVLAAAVCGDDDENEFEAVDSDTAVATATAPPSTVPVQPLEGPTWTLVEAPAMAVPIEGVTVTARFVDGNITGTSGCNTYSGLYQLQGSLLSVAPEIASTRLACTSPASEVESEYLGQLPDVGSFSIDGSRLTLLDVDGTEMLEYETTDGADAIVGDWIVTGYYTGDAISSVLVDVELTATFDGEAVSGNAGCNTFSGPYAVDGDGIQIGPLVDAAPVRRRGARRPGTGLPRRVRLAESYMIAGDRLDLFRSGGAIAVTFQRD